LEGESGVGVGRKEIPTRGPRVSVTGSRRGHARNVGPTAELGPWREAGKEKMGRACGARPRKGGKGARLLQQPAGERAGGC
jgi:hypothetical protein